MKLTRGYSQSAAEVGRLISSADRIIIGAGAGLSASAGFSYSGERFERYFSDFAKKYGIRDMYSGGFYPFKTREEYWAWWSRSILVNRYDCPVGKVYTDLLQLVQGKDYFVLTTNVDHQFQRAGFAKDRLFYTQGDYGLFQCSRPCRQNTYDNEEMVRAMVKEQRDMKIPSELIPRCPVCGAPLVPNLRVDSTFVEDDGWHAAARRYSAYIEGCKGANTLLLELGVGANTPGIIKYPFWRMSLGEGCAYVCINMGEAFAPEEISDRSVCIDGDIAAVLGAVAPSL